MKKPVELDRFSLQKFVIMAILGWLGVNRTLIFHLISFGSKAVGRDYVRD